MSKFQNHYVTQNIVKYLTTDPSITSEIAETDVENCSKLISSINQNFESVQAVPEEDEENKSENNNVDPSCSSSKIPPPVPPRPQNLSTSTNCGIRYLPKDMNTKEFIEVRLPYKIEATRYDKDIGPVDQETGVPLALADQVDSKSKKQWYKQWTKAANKRPSIEEEYGKYHKNL